MEERRQAIKGKAKDFRLFGRITGRDFSGLVIRFTLRERFGNPAGSDTDCPGNA
jgi:hypothetical protein